MRVTSDDGDIWNILEDAIRHKFLPALTDKATFSNPERDLPSLLPRLGGIEGVNPMHLSISQHKASKENPEDVFLSQQNLKRKTRQQNHLELSSLANKIKAALPQNSRQPWSTLVTKVPRPGSRSL